MNCQGTFGHSCLARCATLVGGSLSAIRNSCGHRSSLNSLLVRGMRLAIVLLLFALVSCSEVPVAEDLTQEQAREVVAVLTKHGVHASFSRRRKGVGGFEVSVSEGSFAPAVRILHDAGVPETRNEQFLGILSTNTLLPDSQMVEALRVDYARAVQLEELLENVPGVVSARVVIRLASADVSSSGKGSAYRGAAPLERGVSAVLKVKSRKNTPQEEMEKLIRSALPELGESRIHISVYEGDPEESSADPKSDVTPVNFEGFLFGWRVASDDYRGLVLSILGVILLVSVASALAGYWFGFMTAPPRGSGLNRDMPFEGGNLPLDLSESRQFPEVKL